MSSIVKIKKTTSGQSMGSVMSGVFTAHCLRSEIRAYRLSTMVRVNGWGSGPSDSHENVQHQSLQRHA